MKRAKQFHLTGDTEVQTFSLEPGTSLHAELCINPDSVLQSPR